eukprot:3014308-Rhodomonas_salina.2
MSTPAPLQSRQRRSGRPKERITQRGQRETATLDASGSTFPLLPLSTLDRTSAPSQAYVPHPT